MEKQIKLTVEQAKDLYKSNPEYRNTLLSVFTDKELGIEPNYPKKWFDLKRIDGFFIGPHSDIIEYLTNGTNNSTNSSNFNIFATEKQAKSALAFAQLSQLAKEMNGDWIPDYIDSQPKYTIVRNVNILSCEFWYGKFSLIAFKTKEMAEFSLKHHEQLWKDYYELD